MDKKEPNMLNQIFNYFRLTWLLAWDTRISRWLKVFLILVPVLYTLIPLPDDMLPVIGILDDLILLGLCSFIFVMMCPTAIVQELKAAINHHGNELAYDLDVYHHPDEQRGLAFSFAIIALSVILVGYPAGVLGLLLFVAGFYSSRMMRGQALGNALQVSERQLPEINKALQKALSKLPPIKVELFVTQNPTMNAFSLGYSEPYTIFLTSALVENLTTEEIQAVIGHELGHIYFEHVRLINLMSGLGGGPVRMVFYRWSRACEYSCDGIALLASGGNPYVVISALLKLASGLKDVHVDLDEFLDQHKKQVDGSAAMAESISSHPFINKRIERLLMLAEGNHPIPLVAIEAGSYLLKG
jgi:Zn-dependent protease with chaperone function